ncbi:hypothetical protein [Rhodococcus sp. IEGM 1379]|uniref:hypothetical protein n=1 Tax=Rhodococcus sp. IEGM 1379 TaxID=3047086 RepID=UPI0024B6A68F|nr:hypothetical protein [Rhodococcus sp. IEGM 1379]MDI9919064.1 hypothetical protein [Rhodococcus sp. IEGM 1379]
MAEKKSGLDRTEKWTIGLTVVSLMAGGIVFAGLVDRWTGSASFESSVAISSQTSVVTEEPVAEDETEYSFVTPTVDFPTTIPGCESVEAPDDDDGLMYFAQSRGYDDPQFPWFSGSKATVMSDAVGQALPLSVEMVFASARDSLVFGPIFAPDESSGLPGDLSLAVMASTTATATLARDGKHGVVSVSVNAGGTAVPPCVAGSLDERRTLGGGVVIDTHETWSETNGVRSLSRSATLYAPDGTRVNAYADDVDNQTEPAPAPSGVIPLTVDELVNLVALPEFRVSASVPLGIPAPRPGCSGNSGVESNARKLDRDAVARLNSALEEGWRTAPPGMPVLDAPPGSLVLADHDNTTACQAFSGRTDAGDVSFSIVITSGQALPELPNKYDPSYDGHPDSVVVAPDGSMIERDTSDWSGTYRSVVVTRPDGARVSVRSSADSPVKPMTFEQLEHLAMLDGLVIR